jgi:hypothetical protein
MKPKLAFRWLPDLINTQPRTPKRGQRKLATVYRGWTTCGFSNAYTSIDIPKRSGQRVRPSKRNPLFLVAGRDGSVVHVMH